uniref:Uncharacterized protein n=1 Tax=Haptolina brevifila TaxID=156173 RepID=A0A7S2CSD8_9EUKA|mmetsp:Transcript_28364/g.57184  ORF Transcript_28364/g.57184 Transcript_28364/m.57184 type:complete len:203 (+) Transcript_28364:2-610(+)
MKSVARLLVIATLQAVVLAWDVSRIRSPSTNHKPALGRRAVITGFGCSLALQLGTVPKAVLASGGATSGKTTSIPRAKLRYYSRITTAVSRFQLMSSEIANGETQGAKAFFAEVEGSPFPEIKTAGFLLAVAFKIDSKIPPDKIQQVRDHRVLMKDLEKLKAAVSGGKKAEMASALENSKISLNVWLKGVELPVLGDLRYDT